MVRIKNNRDMFALKGDPWELEPRPSMPRLSPDGSLTLNRRAHIHELLNPSQPVPHGDHTEEDTCDLDQFTAGHCLPIDIRLRKERNTLLKSMSGKPSAGIGAAKRSIIASRNRLTKMRASRLVKVK